MRHRSVRSESDGNYGLIVDTGRKKQRVEEGTVTVLGVLIEPEGTEEMMSVANASFCFRHHV